MTVKAIETRYNGYRFRSRTEARWAVFFDAAGIRYEYEKEGYALPSGPYLPDFWLPDFAGGIWFEVKGAEPTWEEGTKARELAELTKATVYVAWGGVTEDAHRIWSVCGVTGNIEAVRLEGRQWAFDAAKSARFEHGESGAPSANLAPMLEPVFSAPAEIAAPRGAVEPFLPSNAGGLLDAVSRWTLETGRRPVPEFAMMSAIAFAAGLYGRRFVGPTGVGLNLYLVGIGASALGKGHPLKALRTLANDCGLLHMVAAGVPTSDSAIERILRKLPSQVLPLDEFGLLMQSTNGRNSSSWTATVRRALLELYSLSTDMWMGKQFSDPLRPAPTPLHCPTLTLMAVTTPTTFYDGLSESNLKDGFLNRLTVIHATEMPERREAPAIMNAPPSLIAAVKAAIENAKPVGFAGAAYRDPEQRPKMASIGWASSDAERRWLEIEDWQIGQIEEMCGNEGIVGRVAEQTQKLATLRALSRDGRSASVTVDDVEWGYAVVQRSVDCLEKGIAKHMSRGEFDAVVKSILSALRKADGAGLSMGTLLRQRGVSKSDRQIVEGALIWLVETGEVVKTEGRIRLAHANDNRNEYLAAA